MSQLSRSAAIKFSSQTGVMAEGNVEDCCLSFFTTSHPNHDPKWRMAGLNFSVICVACLVETLGDTETRLVRKRKVLGELATLLQRDTQLPQLLSDNPRVTSHLCSILLSLLVKDNELLVKLTIELIQEIVCKLRSDKLTEEVVSFLGQCITKNQNLMMSYAHISLFGRLLNSVPVLAELLAQKSDLLQFLLENLCFPEDRIQTAILFVLTLVCKSETSFSLLSRDFKYKLFSNCCSILTFSKTRDVQLNSLAAMKWLLKQSDTLLSPTHSGKNLADALKKVLLSTDETLQITSIQVISDILARDTEDWSYAREFLQSGIGEFLFEGLETNNEIVLGSLFCCFSHLCKTDIFFEGGYPMYGIESVILGLKRALQLQNTAIIRKGLEVLTLILTNQTSSVPLFPANPAVFDGCIRVLQEGLKSPEHKVLIQATYAVEQLLHLRHMPPIAPLATIVSLLSAAMSHLKRFMKPLTSFKNVKSGTTQYYGFDWPT